MGWMEMDQSAARLIWKLMRSTSEATKRVMKTILIWRSERISFFLRRFISRDPCIRWYDPLTRGCRPGATGNFREVGSGKSEVGTVDSEKSDFVFQEYPKFVGPPMEDIGGNLEVNFPSWPVAW